MIVAQMKPASLVLAVLFVSQSAFAECRFTKVFKWSAAALVAGSAVDIASSYGQPELNRYLASNGRLTSRGVGIKLGVVAGILVAETLIVRRMPEARTPFTGLNFAATGMYTGVAVRNWRNR